jgi:hypothetical protein
MLRALGIEQDTLLTYLLRPILMHTHCEVLHSISAIRLWNIYTDYHWTEQVHCRQRARGTINSRIPWATSWGQPW